MSKIIIMSKKIYYITRSFYPYQSGGGPLIRKSAVEWMERQGFKVVVVMPNYESNKIIMDENMIQFPYQSAVSKWSKLLIRKDHLLTRIGIKDDYLDSWVDSAYKKLIKVIKKTDTIFSTTGGELGCIKLGGMLKEKLGCKHVVNYHDPINHTLVCGLKVNEKFHISREKNESKYISNSDMIITSSKTNASSLIKKYPYLRSRIKNNYFGYIVDAKPEEAIKKKSTRLRIAYSGSMDSKAQTPELLLDLYRMLKDEMDLEIYFIGDTSSNDKIYDLDGNVKIMGLMPHDEYMGFMTENIDIGFVSLGDEYFKACVPSKIYEYINLHLPIIGVLPEGDAKAIVNDNQFGKIVSKQELGELRDYVIGLKDPSNLKILTSNVISKRNLWSMEYTSKELKSLLKTIENS